MKSQKSKVKIQNYNSKVEIINYYNIYSNITKGLFSISRICCTKTFRFFRQSHKLRLLVLLTFAFCLLNSSPVLAQSIPTSANYKMINYGFGGGGTASSSSTNYSLFGTLGQVDQGSPSSANYFIGAGLEFTLQASVSAAPTFTNPSSWYNKLKLTINRGGNDPADYKYAIRVASGSGSFQYVQNDNTLGPDLGLEDWQTYASWGASSGFNIIGLYPGTTYTAQVAAKQGDFFTQFFWSPTALATTENSTLSFDIDISSSDTETSSPYTVAIGNLSPGSVTTAPNKVWVDIATNATNGGIIYILGTNTGLLSSTASYTISALSNDLTSVSEGYGAQNSTTTQVSGGPMQAIAPYNGASNNVGILDTAKRTIYDSSNTAVTGGRVSFLIKAKASNTTPAASDYADTITVLVTGSF